MFNEQLPKWDAQGVEPPESKKVTGYKPEEKPPADWFNWIFNRIYKVLQEIRNTVYQKSEVDANIKAHADVTTGAHGATSAAAANTIIQRDANGQANVGTPTAASHIARKQDVDSVSSAVGSANDAAAAAQRTANNALNRANASLPKDGSEAMTNDLSFDAPPAADSWSRRIYLKARNAASQIITSFLQADTLGRLFYNRNGSAEQVWTSGTMGPGSGLNADKVDDIHGTDLVLKTYLVGDGTPLTWLTTSGFYRLSTGHPEAPPGVDYGQMIVCHGGGDTILQIITGHNNNNIYWRQGNPPEIGGGGSWQPWRKIWHDGNMGKDSGLDAGSVCGAVPDARNVPWAIVQRDANGHFEASTANFNSSAVNHVVSFKNPAGEIRLYPFSDGYDYIQSQNSLKLTALGGGKMFALDIEAEYLKWNGNNQVMTRLNGTAFEYWNGGAWMPNGGIKKVQRGLLTHSSAGAEIPVDIGAVNVDKAYVLISYTGEYSTYAINSDIRARLISSTQVGFYKRSANPVELAWQVVEFN